MSTPPAPGEPADAPLDCTLAIASQTPAFEVFVLNGQSYMQAIRCQRTSAGHIDGNSAQGAFL
jgi:hypothetical protein